MLLIQQCGSVGRGTKTSCAKLKSDNYVAILKMVWLTTGSICCHAFQRHLAISGRYWCRVDSERYPEATHWTCINNWKTALKEHRRTAALSQDRIFLSVPFLSSWSGKRKINCSLWNVLDPRWVTVPSVLLYLRRDVWFSVLQRTIHLW